jgi:hypothetical protein
MYGDKITCVHYQRQALPIGGPFDVFIKSKILFIYLPIWGSVELASKEYVEARRVRTDQRGAVGVGSSGGHPGSNAKEGRSLAVD